MADQSKESVIRTEALEKIYESNGIKTHALRGIDLVLEAGEFAALAGPSGSGKSTLLDLIGALLKPTAGEVWLKGQALSELSRDEQAQLRLREVGFVFQAYNLIPVLTVLENAAFVMELLGISQAERHRKAMDVLKTLEVDEYASRFPNKLSGGQQQRVAVARAVASGPSLVLADEPTANLDSKTGKKLIDLMRVLNQERDVTFLFATHDPMLLEHVDRVIHLRDGEIVEDERKAT